MFAGTTAGPETDNDEWFGNGVLAWTEHLVLSGELHSDTHVVVFECIMAAARETPYIGWAASNSMRNTKHMYDVE